MWDGIRPRFWDGIRPRFWDGSFQNLERMTFHGNGFVQESDTESVPGSVHIIANPLQVLGRNPCQILVPSEASQGGGFKSESGAESEPGFGSDLDV